MLKELKKLMSIRVEEQSLTREKISIKRQQLLKRNKIIELKSIITEVKNSVEHLAYLSIQREESMTLTIQQLKLSSLTILQSHSNQNSTLAQKQTQGSMKETRETRNKPTHLQSINFQQKTQN